jgi:hypothetical protein
MSGDVFSFVHIVPIRIIFSFAKGRLPDDPTTLTKEKALQNAKLLCPSL